jgi:four helix bundle protein
MSRANAGNVYAKSTNRAFDYHLEVALGSTFEVIAAGQLAAKRGYVSEQQRQALDDEDER